MALLDGAAPPVGLAIESDPTIVGVLVALTALPLTALLLAIGIAGSSAYDSVVEGKLAPGQSVGVILQLAGQDRHGVNIGDIRVADDVVWHEIGRAQPRRGKAKFECGRAANP